MGTVHSIVDPSQELSNFFDYIYEDQTGYVYSPTKQGTEFQQYFFNWPVDKQALIDHCIRYSATHEVYYGPGLFTEPSAKKEHFKGTYFVWAEFDGDLPKPELDAELPPASCILQSSVTGHQHRYWRLQTFQTDSLIVEDISQRLAYYLGADLSGWDVNQVLRPPGTRHHASGQLVTVLRWEERRAQIEDFSKLPEIPVKLLQSVDLGYVPDALDVINKYVFSDEDFKFFKTREIPVGQRSSALTKFGHICMEMGMSNAETLCLLLNLDNRPGWGKYKSRRDQQQRLLGIINYCRSKHQGKETKATTLKVLSYREFMEAEVSIEWLIPDLLPVKGQLSLSGKSGVGKSQVTLRFAEKLAKGEQFLKWPTAKPIRSIYVSMEMSDLSLRHFLDSMKMPHSDLLDTNFLVMPLGASLRLGNKKSQQLLFEVVDQFKPELIMLDSFGKGVGEEISSEASVFNVLDFTDQLREGFNLATWWIHHPRKGQVGNKVPDKLDDLFGSQYIGAAMDTVINLQEKGPHIEISCLKMRLAPPFKPFLVRRTPNLDFTLAQGMTMDKDKPIFSQSTGVDLGDTI